MTKDNEFKEMHMLSAKLELNLRRAEDPHCHLSLRYLGFPIGISKEVLGTRNKRGHHSALWGSLWGGDIQTHEKVAADWFLSQCISSTSHQLQELGPHR